MRRYHDPGDWMQSPTGEYMLFADHEAEVARLKDALFKYARHGAVTGPMCEFSKHSAYPCTCGLEEIFHSLVVGRVKPDAGPAHE